MPRGRGDQLTGGSGDVSPQWFTLPTLTMSAPNTFTEISIPLPVQRISLPSKKSLVMEVLKVMFYPGELDTNLAAGGAVAFINMQLGTISQTVATAANPQNVAFAVRFYRGAFTAAQSYMVTDDTPMTLDLTDGGGHGVLVATDNLFLDMTTANYAGASTLICRLLFRWKLVSLEEYIGIVQAQQ
jgi:hypothetical protein